MRGKHDRKVRTGKHSDNEFVKRICDAEIIKKCSKKISNNFMAVFSLIVSILGLIIAIQNQNIGLKVLFCIIIVHSSLILIYGIFITANFLNEKNIKLQFDHDMDKMQLKHSQEVSGLYEERESILLKYKKFLEAYDNSNKNNNYIMDTLQMYVRRLDRYNDEFVNTITEEKSELSEIGEKESGFFSSKTIDNILEKRSEKYIKNLSENFYEDYKRFLRNITDKTKSSIEQYLSSKGYNQTISITLKQFIDAVDRHADNIFQAKPYVYTAFRDFETYRQNIRMEKEPRLYTIFKNSDLLQCLEKEFFIFNNENGKNPYYINENEAFYNFYDSGATSLISYKSNFQENKIMYGFLTCDTKSKSSEKNIIDEQVAMMVEFSANVIAVYFDSIDHHWNSVMKFAESDKILFPKNECRSFWDLCYKKYLEK